MWRILAINALVLAVALAAIEVTARVLQRDRPQTHTLQWQTFAPYLMFTNPHVPGGGFRWHDVYHQPDGILAKIINNKRGFPMREEVDFAKVRPKAPGERVVILSGGSTAWGVGSTSNETSVAGRLQTLLNEQQSAWRYTVLNLSIGGWVSTQQMIALAMYGRNLQPDWLVTMDGWNDVAVACAHSQGAGYPLYSAQMEALISSYMFGQLQPVFLRGRIANVILRHSAAARWITGQEPINFRLTIDESDRSALGRTVIRPTDWSDVERQLELYLATEAAMIDLLPDARVVLGTQAVVFGFDDIFVPPERQDAIAQANRGRACGRALWEDARRWFWSRSAERLDALATAYRARGREVDYLNTGVAFPKSFEERRRYFIDPAHYNDAGADKVARLYAEAILRRDNGVR